MWYEELLILAGKVVDKESRNYQGMVRVTRSDFLTIKDEVREGKDV